MAVTITRLLVANRGEIARRVFATCRRLGIETIAVHSDADADLPFVREADAAVRLPGNSPADTYLRADLVLEAARRTGADAIHPGYGFLSENAEFARAVIDAGITWLGPAPESIEQMGSKIESKRLMAEAGVPVLDNLLPESAKEVDLPLLVKASAGGGGRGMRVVRTLAELPRQIELAAAEAESAFGDPTVFVEPYIEHGRHVEVQVLGDTHGYVSVLGERDCSIQRRHQKVIEEAPAPNIASEVVKAMHEAARKAAEAIAYVGAGTVEFLYDAERERFFFLEMNTRLQVEHPVTEAVFGIDLVAAQIAVAEGATVESCVPRRAGARPQALDPQPEGHAIEARLYAEDPAHDWQPQSGTMTTFAFPGVDAEFTSPGSYGVRLDSGFESGSEVSTHYDAMLAKVVAWAPTRAEAARMLASTLSRATLHGVLTNRDLLLATLRDQAFLEGQVSTDFFQRRGIVVTGERQPPDEHLLLAAAVALAEQERGTRTVQSAIPVAWRNVVSQPQRTVFADPRGSATEPAEHVVEWYGGRDGYTSVHDGAHGDVRVLAASPDSVTIEVNRIRTRVAVTIAEPTHAGTRAVFLDSRLGSVHLVALPRFVDPAAVVAQGSLLAPMPGTVIGVPLDAGAPVTAGQTVLVLEAMKMQHSINAPTDGVLTEVAVAVGDQVASGEVLAIVTPADQIDGSDHSAAEGDQP